MSRRLLGPADLERCSSTAAGSFEKPEGDLSFLLPQDIEISADESSEKAPPDNELGRRIRRVRERLSRADPAAAAYPRLIIVWF